jgi:meiotically up-regulated gene 157 (Mug157) protein
MHKLAVEIKEAIYKYGITHDNEGNNVFAYEVDGFGRANKMDDANVPSLLSLPYLGFVDKNDEIYLNTRKLILS